MQNHQEFLTAIIAMIAGMIIGWICAENIIIAKQEVRIKSPDTAVVSIFGNDFEYGITELEEE